MGQLTQFAPFLLMFVVIYFFMIRPQQKRAKQEKEFESALKVGDKIITKSGLHGKSIAGFHDKNRRDTNLSQ